MEEVKKPRLTKYGLDQMEPGDKKLHRCRATDRDRIIGSLKALFRKQKTELGKVFTLKPVQIGVEYTRES